MTIGWGEPARRTPGEHLAHVVAVGAATGEVQALAAERGEAVGVQHARQLAPGVLEQGAEVGLGDEARGHPVLRLAQAQALAVGLGLLLGAHLPAPAPPASAWHAIRWA